MQKAQHTWATRNYPYPYNTGTNGDDLLNRFKEYWNKNFFSEGYDLAHLWTGKDTLERVDEDGQKKKIGGLAWIGVVCGGRFNRSRDSYGFSQRGNIGLHKFIAPAHEVGHNFGAVHPDQEDPPIASCVSTIMQGNSVGDRLTFCEFSRNKIRNHVSAHNRCLEAEGESITVNPPSNLSATAIGSSQIRLTWRDNSTNETIFGIARKAVGEDWAFLVALGPNSTEFIDAGLLPTSTYSYQVAAIGDSDDSYAESNIATATTLNSDPGGGRPNLTQWVIPTRANTPGRFGAFYRTKVILTNFDSDLDLVVRLYGPNGFVDRRTYSIDARHYRVWGNFLSDFFNYQGAGAVEFSGNAPFVVSAEVYTTSPSGTYTTVVHNGPSPLPPYLSGAESVGGITVDDATRTNVGVFNNSNRSQTVTARVYYGGDDPVQTISFDMAPKGWAQKSVSARGSEGYIFWRVPQEAYLWVVSVDNRSNDGTLAVPTPLR